MGMGSASPWERQQGQAPRAGASSPPQPHCWVLTYSKEAAAGQGQGLDQNHSLQVPEPSLTLTVPVAGECPTLSRDPTLAWAFSLKFSFWFSILTSPPPAGNAAGLSLGKLQQSHPGAPIPSQPCPGAAGTLWRRDRTIPQSLAQPLPRRSLVSAWKPKVGDFQPCRQAGPWGMDRLQRSSWMCS